MSRTVPTPRIGPFVGPPRVQRVTMPTGNTILTPERPYSPSWLHAARVRTTWTNCLGGHYGLVGHHRKAHEEHL